MKDVGELCRGLLRKARSDRIAMKTSLAARVLDAACFHAQQIAEKCLKAFLAHSGVSFPYTHNLVKLIVDQQETSAKQASNVRFTGPALDVRSNTSREELSSGFYQSRLWEDSPQPPPIWGSYNPPSAGDRAR